MTLTALGRPGWLPGALLFITGLIPASPPAQADQTDPRLDGLFARLQADDGTGARELEAAIWRIWFDGGSEEANELLARGRMQERTGRIAEAVHTYDRLVAIAPRFAEAYNRRATVYYILRHLSASMRDVERTLALEPRHYGAVFGKGLILIERSRFDEALEAFDEVHRINPHATGVELQRRRIEMLREAAGG